MNTLEFIEKLRNAGIRLSINEGQIRLKAKKGSLTNELKQEIATRKQDIIALLGSSAEDKADNITRANRNGPLLLSYAQQRLWFLDELEPGTPVYNMPFALRVQGDIARPALQSAVDQLVKKHETLRTVFLATDKEPVQKILDSMDVAINYQDLQSGSEADVSARLGELAKEGFNLVTGPLLRLHLLQTGANEYYLLLVIHHIISDLWSMDVFFRDLGKLYERQNTDVAPATEDLPVQYADYAAWQRTTLTGPRLDGHLKYWLGQLDDAPPVLELATDHPRPPEPGYQGKWLANKLGGELSKQLHLLAQDSGCTMFMLSFAVFTVLLNKYTCEDDIVIGTPISGRQQSELEQLIGFFLNTLALRTDLSANPSFRDLLKQVKQTALNAYAHQELPFEKLVEELQPERDMSHTPVFQHMFIWQDISNTQLQLAGLKTEPATLISHETAKFDLTLALSNTPEGIEAGIEYNTDLFERTTIERMLGHYETLLHSIVANPDVKLAELSLLDERERNTVVTDFNSTDVRFTQQVCVHQLVEIQAEKTPNSDAIIFADETLSYAELNNRANILAEKLTELGACAGQIVAISLQRSIELPVAALAVLKSGACYVPVDPNYPPDRIAAMLHDSAAVVVLSQSGVKLPEHAGQRLDLDSFEFNGTANNPAHADPANPLYCIYTSGSTGKPKGVQLSHAGLANLLNWQLQHERLGAPARTLQFASFSFDVSFQELFSTWSNGGTLVMIDEELRQDLPRLAGFIAEEKIERLYLPYAALQPIAEALATREDMPALRDVIVAGEQLQVSPEVRAMFHNLQDAALHNQYGPSETHVVTALTMTGDATNWPALPSIGFPVANTRCYILDNHGEPCPIGIPGELYLGGVQVALGYLNRPELDAEKFSSSSFREGECLYRTGDRARVLNDGQLEFLGRADEQVKWRGFRIEPGEIEAQLTDQESVQQAVVLLREDIPGDKRLVAYVTGTDADPDKLKQTLKGTLPDYMVPSVILQLAELPLTPSGKVARRRLPAPAYSRDANTPYAAARNATEEALVKLWADVLNIDASKHQVGIDDDFFYLGGHSLLATQLVSRIRDHFGISLPLKYIFRYPSPAQLGEAVSTLEAALNPAQTVANDDRDEFRI